MKMISSNRVCSQLKHLDSSAYSHKMIKDKGNGGSIINFKLNAQNLVEKKNGTKIRLTCEVCSKRFYSGSTYQKHVKDYPNKHKFYKCCNKIEESDNIHECKKKTTSTKKATATGIFVESKDNQAQVKTNENYKDNHNKNDNNYNNNKDNYNEDDGHISDIDVDDNHGDGDSDSDDDDYFEEVFGKRKVSKRKLEGDKSEDENHKIFKCQKCLKTFHRYVNLSQHNKMVHNKQGKFKCQTCDEEFKTNQSYELHVALHGPEDKVVCKGCKKVFDSLKLYYIHARLNPGVHCFLCKLCFRKFPTEVMLEQHVCICQNGKPLHCACGQEFTKFKDVVAHSKGTKPFHCCSCPHMAASLTAYIRHLRKHSKQKPFQCSKCDMKFAVIDFLNIHMKKQHSENTSEVDKEQIPSLPERHLCTICDEEFTSADELKKHGLQHERVQCPDCGKLFKRNRLENHRNNHKTSASLCPECGKLFDTRFKLTQHIITTHSKEPAKCEICLKVLKTKKILNEHMKTHLKSEVGVRIPQAICPMCGLGLAQKGSLARHILLTHEKHKIVPCDKTYTCQECSAVLPNKGKYYSHRRMHRAMVDRFPCEICGREFNKKQNLRRHIYLLHDEKRVVTDAIFDCQICVRSFREKKNLKRHYKMVHKSEDFP